MKELTQTQKDAAKLLRLMAGNAAYEAGRAADRMIDAQILRDEMANAKLAEPRTTEGSCDRCGWSHLSTDDCPPSDSTD